jgi:hypothetical protein
VRTATLVWCGLRLISRHTGIPPNTTDRQLTEMTHRDSDTIHEQRAEIAYIEVLLQLAEAQIKDDAPPNRRHAAGLLAEILQRKLKRLEGILAAQRGQR